jgi:hypothetical protein
MAARSIRPPGFGGAEAVTRGRTCWLGSWAAQATTLRNLVTMFQNPANSPVMPAVEAGEVVDLTVTPVHRGLAEIPIGVTMTGRGNQGFELIVTILNRGR